METGTYCHANLEVVMNVKLWLLLFALPLLAVSAGAQESARDLKGTGQFGAFLTPGQVDRWSFEGDKGETIIAHVVSKEFDPILGLSRTGAKDDDTVLFEYDDPGNESRFSFRLPEKGKYKIRVNAFKFQGGGNYKLSVQRFHARPLTVGTPLVGTFDREGKSYHYFQGARDQILVPELKGTSPGAWTLLDFKGRRVSDWAGSVLFEDAGENHMIVSGPPEQRYDLVVREARRQELPGGKALAASLGQGELDVVSFQARPGDFRLLEVEKKGSVLARLVYAPVEKKNEQRIARPGDQPELALLPVASRGGRLRFAAILGREGRYQLQLLAHSPVSYTLTARDPSEPIEWGKDALGTLPVGGAAFYSFKAAPGQLLRATVTSQKFIPVLRLYDAHGNLVTSGSDDAEALEGRITHMVVNEGLYRLHASSLGDGGGGEFRQSLDEIKLKELAVGGRAQGKMQAGATDFWTFAGKEGQTVFLNVRSAAFEPAVSLRSPEGVHLAADNKGSPQAGSLLALKLPKTGRYTVWIASQRGAGDYTIRLIDADN
jgi:hypothetical protein